MVYEQTPITAPSIERRNSISKKIALKGANELSTTSLLWLIVKRHKTGLLATWAVSVTTVQLFPFAPSLILSVFK